MLIELILFPRRGFLKTINILESLRSGFNSEKVGVQSLFGGIVLLGLGKGADVTNSCKQKKNTVVVYLGRSERLLIAI